MKNTRELKEQYPKCFLPLEPPLMVQSVVFPENRIPLHEWFLKIYDHES